MAVTVRLTDDIDVSRGDMICRPRNSPAVAQDIDAMVCWMVDAPLQQGVKYTIKHTTRTARAVVKEVQYRLDINTLHRVVEPGSLHLNEIGRVQLRTTSPLLCDAYRRNRGTGGFILVDEGTNRTAGAGIILGT
jgi:bifunctional enzyme CysN/CysC